MRTTQEQIDKRRIFGIISHPDAGKTTLTEKLLLSGGAIREAGTVKARKNSKYATSDWMEIEKQRGISVTSSVMQFEYGGKVVSIMDTPGHNDFGEDTYRILTSVDSAVMVIDAAKGIEAQTKKLFKVCSMRGIPIFTFMNKLDREARDPLELMQELEDVLGLPSVAVNWPIGSGRNFYGIVDLLKNRALLYKENMEIELGEESVFGDGLDKYIPADALSRLRDEIELIKGAGNVFDKAKIDGGKLSPVFFGSALTGFGVDGFLEHFLEFSPPPGPRRTTDGEVKPTDDFFSAFVFKIQANMNPAHRDRLAFLRICSGVFERGMEVCLTRSGKTLRLSQSTQLMANERQTIDRAYAGDIIGIYDSGNFMIGDSLADPKHELFFEPLPTFPPELFALVSPKLSMKGKHFQKGVEQLAQEGAVQIYRNEYNEVIIGAVGRLQFEVFEYRLKNEYNTEVDMRELDFSLVRWIRPEQLDEVKQHLDSRTMLVYDRSDRPLLMFANRFTLNYYTERHKDIELIEAFELS